MARFEFLTEELISFKCSGMFHHVDWYEVTETMEAYVASKYMISSIISHSLKQTTNKLKFFGTFTNNFWLGLCGSFTWNIFKLLNSYLLSVMIDPVITLLSLQHLLSIYSYLIRFLVSAFTSLYFLTCFIFTHPWTNVRSMKWCVCVCVCVCVCAWLCVCVCVCMCVFMYSTFKYKKVS